MICQSVAEVQLTCVDPLEAISHIFNSILDNLCKAAAITAPGIISLSFLSLATDVTDLTLGASGYWLETRTGAGGSATVA